jgi:hypothetical protein
MSAEWLGVLVSMGNVLVTLYIAHSVQKASRNVVRMEQDRGIKDAWIAIDRAALDSEENLHLLDAMIHPDAQEEDRLAKRKRWLAYMVLNPLEAAWTSASNGSMHADALQSSERTMASLVRDPEVFELIEGFVYGGAFRRRCIELRNQWLSACPAQATARPPSTCSVSPVQ